MGPLPVRVRTPDGLGAPEADSTGDSEILETVHDGDLLLGVQDAELGKIVLAWGRLDSRQRGSVAVVVNGLVNSLLAQ